jgi:hypothetical protein
VTGVQTCALPISTQRGSMALSRVRRSLREIWRRRTKMMMAVMRMERRMRFNDKAPG